MVVVRLGARGNLWLHDSLLHHHWRGYPYVEKTPTLRFCGLLLIEKSDVLTELLLFSLLPTCPVHFLCLHSVACPDNLDDSRPSTGHLFVQLLDDRDPNPDAHAKHFVDSFSSPHYARHA